MIKAGQRGCEEPLRGRHRARGCVFKSNGAFLDGWKEEEQEDGSIDLFLYVSQAWTETNTSTNICAMKIRDIQSSVTVSSQELLSYLCCIIHME